MGLLIGFEAILEYPVPKLTRKNLNKKYPFSDGERKEEKRVNRECGLMKKKKESRRERERGREREIEETGGGREVYTQRRRYTNNICT